MVANDQPHNKNHHDKNLHNNNHHNDYHDNKNNNNDYHQNKNHNNNHRQNKNHRRLLNSFHMSLSPLPPTSTNQPTCPAAKAYHHRHGWEYSCHV